MSVTLYSQGMGYLIFTLIDIVISNLDKINIK